MKKITSLLLCLFIVSLFSGCEKDDICAQETQTTPSVAIEFYDKDNTTELKNVVNLKVIAEGMEEGAPLDETGAVVSNDNKISIPLRTDANSTTYRFIYNATSTESLNEDIVTFYYTRTQIYVSRACGYKSIFQLTNEQNNPELTDFINEEGTPDGLWIYSIEKENNSIENENEAHIKIYF